MVIYYCYSGSCLLYICLNFKIGKFFWLVILKIRHVEPFFLPTLIDMMYKLSSHFHKHWFVLINNKKNLSLPLTATLQCDTCERIILNFALDCYCLYLWLLVLVFLHDISSVNDKAVVTTCSILIWIKLPIKIYMTIGSR